MSVNTKISTVDQFERLQVRVSVLLDVRGRRPDKAIWREVLKVAAAIEKERRDAAAKERRGAAGPDDIKRHKLISESAQIVAWLLWSYANRDGVAMVLASTLATDAGLSVSTVREALHDLRALGLVTVHRRRRGAWKYRLNLMEATPYGMQPRIAAVDDLRESRNLKMASGIPAT